MWDVVQGLERRGAIVGGSIAGCAAAIACGHAGLPVDIYERSGGELAERGFGITMPSALHDRLVEADYLDASMPVHEGRDRTWLVRDPSRPYQERELIRSPTQITACSWNLVWCSLRGRVPDSAYHAGERVELNGEELHLAYNGASGTTRPFDLVIGADGINSAIRRLVSPHSVQQSAGYVIWRAQVVLDKLSGPLETMRETGVTVMFPAGHGIYYLIPDADGAGRLVVNWVVYTRMPELADIGPERTYPPGTAPELVAYIKDLTHCVMPPAWAQVVEQTPDADIAIYPVYDLEVDSYACGPLLLAGDAGAVTRPHTGSGAVKALGDALCLERVLLEGQPSLRHAAERYSRERTVEGNKVVELGRRLGRTHVEEVPDFSLMGDADVQAWLETPFKGEEHYIFRGANKKAGRAAR